MLQKHIILAVAWIMFCALHSILASGIIKRASQKRMGKYFPRYRLLYVLFSLAGFAGIVLFQVLLVTSYVFTAPLWLKTAGILIALAGSIVMVISICKYFRGVSGLWSNDKNTLSCRGLNRYVRHPLYLGSFGLIWGWFLITPYWSLLISNIIITVYTLIAIGFEEEKLEKEFGESYLFYKKKVPMIIPTFKTINLPGL